MVEQIQDVKILLRERQFPFFTDEEIQRILQREGFEWGVYLMAKLKSAKYNVKSGNTKAEYDMAESLRELAKIYYNLAKNKAQNLEELNTAETNARGSKIVQLTND